MNPKTPIPEKNELEASYMQRCTDCLAEYDSEERVSMCLTAFRGTPNDVMGRLDFSVCSTKYLKDIELGFEEDLTEENLYIPTEAEYEDFGEETEEVLAVSLFENKSHSSEYQGRKVTLNKPFRTPKGPKKFSVYTKNEKGNVVKVNFGDPNMTIKKNNPERRKSFRARHNCDNPGPKWKSRYWSCKNW